MDFGALARAALAFLASALLLIPIQVSAAKKPPKLGGTWQLNLKESDTLQQKLDAMRSSGGGAHGGGMGGRHGGMGGGFPGGFGGGHHGGGGGGGGYGGSRGGGEGERAADTDSTRRVEMQELAHPPMTMVVEPGEDAYVLSERGKAVEIMVLGDAAAVAASQPDALHLQAKWKGKKLVGELVGPNGGKMTQEIELSDHDKKLTIRTKLESRSGRQPLELKRVYDRSTEVTPPPAAATTATAAPAAPDSTRR